MERSYRIKNDIKYLMIIDVIILITALISGLVAGLVSGWTAIRIYTSVRSVCCMIGSILLIMAAVELIRKRQIIEGSDTGKKPFGIIPFRYVLIQAGTVALLLGIMADTLLRNTF